MNNYHTTTGHVHGEVDGLRLHNGETYFVIIQGTNMLGYTYSLHSNGTTVKMETPLPGHVRDGNIVGIDLRFQSSQSALSANWDGFGYDANDDGGFEFNGRLLVLINVLELSYY